MGVAGPGPHRQHVTGLAADPQQRRHTRLTPVSERRALLGRPVGGHQRGVGVDGDPLTGRGCAHGPRPSQDRAVHRRRLLGPAQVGAGQEPEQRRVRRERVLTPQRFSGTLQQRPVRQELAARQQHLDQGAVALTAAVTARPDRAEVPGIGRVHHVEPVQQRPPQRRTGHAGHVLVGHRHLHPGGLPARTDDQFPGIEQRHGRGSVHLSGAPLAGRIRVSQLESSPEPVKAGETTAHADLMSASGVGSLIQATVGSFGGVGGRCRNRAGLAA
jgi:hypothetical protein